MSDEAAAARPDVATRWNMSARCSARVRCDWGFAHSRAPWAGRGCVRRTQPQHVLRLRRVEIFWRDLPFASAATGALPTVALRGLAYSRGFRLNHRHEPNTRAPPIWPAA